MENHRIPRSRLHDFRDFFQELDVFLNVIRTQAPQLLQTRVGQGALDFAKQERRNHKNMIARSDPTKNLTGRSLGLYVRSDENISVENYLHCGWERT